MVDDDKYSDNAATTAILLDAGIALMRENVRRRHPGETDAETDARLSRWLRRVDDPIPGDTAGPVHARERGLERYESPGSSAAADRGSAR